MSEGTVNHPFSGPHSDPTTSSTVSFRQQVGGTVITFVVVEGFTKHMKGGFGMVFQYTSRAFFSHYIKYYTLF